jgi:hypothetical protein
MSLQLGKWPHATKSPHPGPPPQAGEGARGVVWLASRIHARHVKSIRGDTHPLRRMLPAPLPLAGEG